MGPLRVLLPSPHQATEGSEISVASTVPLLISLSCSTMASATKAYLADFNSSAAAPEAVAAATHALATANRCDEVARQRRGSLAEAQGRPRRHSQ